MYHFYRPPPPLASFVDHFWDSGESTLPFTKELALPLGSPQLVVHLGGDEQRIASRQRPMREQVFRESLLRGPRANSYYIDAGRSIMRIGIQFKPGGAYPFFAPPASALRDLHEPLEALWGASARELRERLFDVATPAARFRLLERLLLAQAIRPLVRHPAVDYALCALQPGAGRQSIAQVVEQVGLSHRHFITLFRREVGLTPKEHWRLQRFLAVTRGVGKESSVNWAELAARMGYCDQAHLIRDFHAFAGLSPCAYLRLRHPHFWTYVALADSGARTIT